MENVLCSYIVSKTHICSKVPEDGRQPAFMPSELRSCEICLGKLKIGIDNMNMLVKGGKKVYTAFKTFGKVK